MCALDEEQLQELENQFTKYAGEWIALSVVSVLGHGPTPADALEQARAVGADERDIVLSLIPRHEVVCSVF